MPCPSAQKTKFFLDKNSTPQPGRCKLKRLSLTIKQILLSSSFWAVGASLISPMAHAQQIIWQGSTSDAWDDPSNWQGGTLPTASNDVIINTNSTPHAPKITTSTATTHDVTIGSLLGTTGTADVIGAGATWNQADILYTGYFGNGTMNMSSGGIVATGGVAYTGYETGSIGKVTVDGTGSLWSIGGNSYIGEKGRGTLLINNGGSLITGAYVFIGNQAGSDGNVVVSNNGTMTSVGLLPVGANGKGTLTVATGGRISNGGISIAQNSGSNGTLNIGAASTDTAAAPGILNAPTVDFGAGSGNLVFNHTDTTGDYIFTPLIGGLNGNVNVYSGTTTFDKNNNYAGQTTIHGGKLLVTNTSGSATGQSTVHVATGGTLGGTGIISKDVTVDGNLRPGSENAPGVLTVGNLTLNSSSTVYYRLHEEDNDTSTENDRIQVNGNLAVNNANINAIVSSAGAYLLISYTGTYNNGIFNTPTLTSDLQHFTPAGTVQYTPNAIYLNVTNTSGGSLLFWDGPNLGTGSGHALGAGGTAIWNATSSNWTDFSGNTSNIWDPLTGIAVFAGTAGTVTIEGNQDFNTLQFLTNGYTLTPGAGGTLQLNPAGTGTSSNINVLGSTKTVEISVPIVDGTAQSLNIVGGGTAKLLAANTFTGGINIIRSTVEAQAQSAFGTGGITLNAGTIRYANNFDISNSQTISLLGSGTFNTNGTSGSNIAALISGTSAVLYKTGAGSLTLSAANTYTGATRINEGILSIGLGGSIADSSSVQVASGATFDIASSGTTQTTKSLGGAGSVTLGINTLVLTNAKDQFSGVISGSGGLQIISGIETLSGVNTYQGETTIGSGSGVLTLLGAGSIAASSGVQMPLGGLFDISLTDAGASIQSLSGSGSVHLGEKTLTLTNASGNYSGMISNTGGLTLAGGTQTLSYINSYKGVTQINAGTQLNLIEQGQISNSRKVVADGTFDISGNFKNASIQSLAGSTSGQVTLGVRTLTITNSADTFNGTISGIGGLNVIGGTQLLGGSNNYSGQTTVGANLADRTLGTLGATNTNVFSATSPFIIQQYGTLDLHSYNQTIASLDNAGTVRIDSSSTHITNTFTPTILTVTGSYTTNGGRLILNTDLITGISSKLVAHSVVSGGLPTAITTTNTALGGAPTKGSGILLVETQTAADPSAFHLAAPVSAGAYDYKLYYGPVEGTTDPQGWYLRSYLPVKPITPTSYLPDYRAEVPLYTATPALANKFGLTMLGTYHDRNEQRSMNTSSTHVWGRFLGESGNVSYSGSNPLERSQSFNDHGASYSYDVGGFQLGADISTSTKADGSHSVIGGYIGIGHTTSDVDQIQGGHAGNNKFNSYAVGAYWTYLMPQGAYAQAVLQGIVFDQMNADSVRAQHLKSRGWGMALSIEGGYPYKLGSRLVLEPQAQLIFQHTSLKDRADNFGRIDYDPTSSTYGRLGARIYAQDTHKVTPFARANLWHSFNKNANTTVTDLAAANPVQFNTSLGGTWMQIGVGVNAQLKDNLSIMAGADYSRGLGNNKGDSYALRLGLRYAW